MTARLEWQIYYKMYTGQIILKPPLNEKISEFLSRGFIIFQISQNVRLGVLLFSMFDRFWTIFPCKTALKKLKIFSRASRANFSSGVLLFSKSLQMFELGVLPRGGGLILSPR